MRTRLRHVGLAVLGLCVVAFSALLAGRQAPTQDPGSLFVSDSALIQHLWRRDYVFRGVFESCKDEVVSRGSQGRTRTFTYAASCRIRRPASERDDCPTYRVVASGTIDTPEWASVRKWRLDLECSG